MKYKFLLSVASLSTIGLSNVSAYVPIFNQPVVEKAAARDSQRQLVCDAVMALKKVPEAQRSTALSSTNDKDLLQKLLGCPDARAAFETALKVTANDEPALIAALTKAILTETCRCLGIEK